MKITILNAIDDKNPVSNTLKNELESAGGECTWFELESLKILPCRSCGSCGQKTPGCCILDDDMQTIFRAFARSDLIVLLTRISFGGYSSQLNKAVDRFMAISIALYIVKNGHLLHPIRYGKKRLLGIGLADANHPDEDENFKLLVSRNAMNFQYPFQALVFSTSDTVELIRRDISSALEEVR